MWSTDWDVVNAETERRERELIALKVYQNTLVPINRKLPPEIWSEIFIHRRNMSCLRRPYEWITLTQVCTYWRELILHNPILWSHIHAGRNVSCNDYIPRVLARSQRKALTVNIHIDDPLDSNTVEAVSGEIHRVEHLNFYVSTNSRNASGISRNLFKFCSAASHAPEIRLKSLIVWGEREYQWTPRWTEIRLLLSPSIQSLCLNLASFPAVEEARSALRSMPSLVALQLQFTREVSDYSESDVYCPPGEEVRLDRLGNLWLVGPPLLCAALLSSLEFPASTSVTVGPLGHPVRYSDSQHLPLMDVLLRKIQATAVSATRSPLSSMYVKRSNHVGYIAVDTWTTTHTSEILKDRPEGRMLDLVLPEDVALQLIGALGDLLKDVKSMFMSIYCDQAIARAWAGTVRRMINLRELMVVGTACRSLGQILAAPITREEDSGLNAGRVGYAEIEEHLRANPTLLHLHALVMECPEFWGKLNEDYLQRVLDARKALRMGPISTQVKVTDKEMQRIIRKDPNCTWVDGSYSFTYSVVSKPSAATPDEDEW